MKTDFYNVYVNDGIVAENMPLQYVLIFIKAIYVEFYAEPNLKVTIKRINSETSEVVE